MTSSLLHKKINYFNLVLFFSIFCSFNFIPFISAEIQPIVGVFIILSGFISFLFTKKISKPALTISLFFISLIPCLTYSIILNGITSSITYFMYMIGPAIFCYFYKNYKKLNLSQVKFFLYTFTIISIVQALSPDTLNNIINPYFELLIKRARFGFYGDMRGVGILYSEPAHAAKYIFVLMIMYISLKISPQIYSNNKSINKNSLVIILCILICIILNKSASLYFMITFLLLLYFFLNTLHLNPRKLFTLTILSLLTISIGIIATNLNIEFMYPKRISSLVDSFSLVRDNFSLNDIQYFGSIRIISVIAGYAGSIIEPFGTGIGNGGNVIFLIMNQIGFDTNSITFLTSQDVEFLKPNAYGAQIALESGLIGLIMIISLSIYCISKIRITTKAYCFYSSVLIISIFQILLFSTTTVTAPWMTLAISLYALKWLKNEYNH
ncbi:hypothetical protein AB7W56_17400 [Providencia rettgeri]